MEIIDIDKYASPLFLDDMEPLAIHLSGEEIINGIELTLRKSSGETFTESYLGDFDDMVVIDLRDLIRGDFSSSVPDIGLEMIQEEAARDYQISISSAGGAATTLSLTVIACASDAMDAMSDIDIMRIPHDYILPLACYHGGGSVTGVDFILPGGTVAVPEWLSGGEAPALITRLVPLGDTPAASEKSFRVVTRGGISSPQYVICSGNFEQYLFLNRFGGFDNIAMSGDLSLQVDAVHESGKYEGLDVQRSSTATRQWLQRSGYMSEKCVDAFADLICSGQIYHLKDGEWRRIVILESDVQYSKSDTLHSFSFKFKYSDSGYTGFRPASCGTFDKYQMWSELTDGHPNSDIISLAHLPSIPNSKLDNGGMWLLGKDIPLGGSLSVAEARSALGLGSNAYSSVPYLPLYGGMMESDARIYAEGSIHIGDPDNSYYVYMQDMASEYGSEVWSISVDGTAVFQEVTANSFSGLASRAYSDRDGNSITDTYQKISDAAALYVPLAGGAMSGPLDMSSMTDSCSAIMLRTGPSYAGGVGYDTSGDESLFLWAANTVTRFRWHAGLFFDEFESGSMVDLSSPDFEISKADGTARGYVAGQEIIHKGNLLASITKEDLVSKIGYASSSEDGILYSDQYDTISRIRSIMESYWLVSSVNFDYVTPGTDSIVLTLNVIKNDNYEYEVESSSDAIIPAATATNAGLMSSMDKQHLDNLVSITAAPVPVGTVVPFAGKTIPTGWLQCNGTTVSRTTYAALFEAIGTAFGVGDGSTTFNLPNLYNKFIQGTTTSYSSQRGKSVAAGLPNITGSFQSRSVLGAQGAFTSSGDSTENPAGSGYEASFVYKLDFNASKSSSVYGNSTTVQPPAVKMYYIIKY